MVSNTTLARLGSGTSMCSWLASAPSLNEVAQEAPVTITGASYTLPTVIATAFGKDV